MTQTNSLTTRGSARHLPHPRAYHWMGGLMLSGLLVLGLSGCSSRNEPEAALDSAFNQSVEVLSDLENQETNVKITVPDGWIPIGGSQRNSADIYATFPEKNLYTVVVSESMGVLRQFGLEDNAEEYRWLIEKELDTFNGETRTGLDTINGSKAIQYEMRGVVDGVPVVYLHTTVEGTDDYYQIVGWTTADSYGDNKETLQTVIESFQGS